MNELTALIFTADKAKHTSHPHAEGGLLPRNIDFLNKGCALFLCLP